MEVRSSDELKVKANAPLRQILDCYSFQHHKATRGAMESPMDRIRPLNQHYHGQSATFFETEEDLTRPPSEFETS